MVSGGPERGLGGRGPGQSDADEGCASGLDQAWPAKEHSDGAAEPAGDVVRCASARGKGPCPGVGSRRGSAYAASACDYAQGENNDRAKYHNLMRLCFHMPLPFVPFLFQEAFTILRSDPHTLGRNSLLRIRKKLPK
jgi:hypothetical protein